MSNSNAKGTARITGASTGGGATYADRAIDAEVDLGMNEGGYLLRVRLNVSLPGLPKEVAQALVDTAHQICP
jgi:organic hydroperoxide reductase OsmC/OhrA